MQASKLFFKGLSRGLTDEINIFMCKQISLWRNGFFGTRPDLRDW